MRVLYDQDAQADLWGVDLAVHLDEVYRKKSRYVVLFGSVHYVTSIWTSHERRSAQARAIEERGGAYLLPVRLDNTEIPGLPPTIAFLDGRFIGCSCENWASRPRRPLMPPRTRSWGYL